MRMHVRSHQGNETPGDCGWRCVNAFWHYGQYPSIRDLRMPPVILLVGTVIMTPSGNGKPLNNLLRHQCAGIVVHAADVVR